MSANPQKDVLIVDDDEAIRNLLAVVLKRAGLACDTAADGIRAIEHLSVGVYAVLLIDVAMPNLDGPGVLRRMRGFEQADAELPIVIVMTAASANEAIAPVAEMVQAVIAKPFDIHEVRDLVHDCVKGLRRHRA